MTVTSYSDHLAVIELDVNELKILSTALNLLSNVGCIEEDFRQGTGGTRVQVESLLISIHSLTSMLGGR
jgi:hypothetical protein